MRALRGLLLAAALTAGACGGSSTSEQPADPAKLIQDACDNLVGLSCSSAPADKCPSDMNQARAEAASKGCGAAFDGIMVCFADKITDCAQNRQQVCAQEFAALDACEIPKGTEECGQGFGGAPPGAPPYYQRCSVDCAAWGVDCAAKTSPTVVCTCTTGPKAGTTFEITSCSDLTVDLGAPHCKG